MPMSSHEENPVKKSNKMIAAAAAGALLLTGGVTAVANAVSPRSRACRQAAPRRLPQKFSPRRRTS